MQALAAAHPNVSAMQIPQSFWGHRVADGIRSDSMHVANMTWRSGGPFRKGREKLIISTEVRTIGCETLVPREAWRVLTSLSIELLSHRWQLRRSDIRPP